MVSPRMIVISSGYSRLEQDSGERRKLNGEGRGLCLLGDLCNFQGAMKIYDVGCHVDCVL